MKRHLLLLLLALITASCIREGDKQSTNAPQNMLSRVTTLNGDGLKQEAISLVDSAMRLNPADSTRCWLLTEKSVAMLDLGRIKEGLGVAKEAYGLAHKLNDVNSMLNLRGAMGIAYRRMGMNDSALIQYEKGMELAVKENNKEYEVYLNNCITILYASSNRYDEAIQYAMKAEQVALSLKDTLEHLSARANIGGIYLREGKPQEALDAVLPYWQEVKDMDYNVMTLKFLSIILHAYNLIGDYASMDFYMTYAENLMEGMPQNSNGVMGIREIKVDMLGRRGKYREQLALVDSLMTCNSTNRSVPIETLLSIKANCLEKLGRHAEALKTMKETIAVIDSIKNSDVERNMSEFSVKYKTLETEMALAESQREAAEKANQVMGLVIVIVGLVGIVCLMLYYRRVAMQKALLKEKQSYIEGLESERERIAKELHDGVCNDILAAKLLMATDSHQAENYLHDVWQNVRHLSHVLMPPCFQNVTLDAVTRSYVSSVDKNDKHKVVLDIDSTFDWKRLPQQVAYETYRIIQEATGNALKYGEEINISLMVKNGVMRVTVSNRILANVQKAECGDKMNIGQQTLRKRADRIGARLTTKVDDVRYTTTLTYNIR